VRAALCSAVDLVRGLGVLAGIDVVDVEGMSAGYDTDYAAQRDACLAALGDGVDLFLVHVEASDEAGHAGDVGEKVTSLERWDELILGPLVEGLDGLGPWRLLLLPDHPTPTRLRTARALSPRSPPHKSLALSVAAGLAAGWPNTATGARRSSPSAPLVFSVPRPTFFFFAV